MTLNRRRRSKFVSPLPACSRRLKKKINILNVHRCRCRPIFYDRKNGFAHRCQSRFLYFFLFFYSSLRANVFRLTNKQLFPMSERYRFTGLSLIINTVRFVIRSQDFDTIHGVRNIRCPMFNCTEKSFSGLLS